MEFYIAMVMSKLTLYMKIWMPLTNTVQKETRHKGYILYDFIYIKYKIRQN